MVTLSSTITRSQLRVDRNGWPDGFFDEVAGSMPELRRWQQGEFEAREPLG